MAACVCGDEDEGGRVLLLWRKRRNTNGFTAEEGCPHGGKVGRKGEGG